MITNVNVARVLITSPSDVQQEKGIIEQSLQKWNNINAERCKLILLPISWEKNVYSETGTEPQDIINRQIVSSADLLVGVFWTRIGTKTAQYESGSVEEIGKFLESGKPVMLYFCNRPVAPESLDPNQYKRLKAFKQKAKHKSVYFEYDSLELFADLLFTQISLRYSKAGTQKREGGDIAITKDYYLILKSISEYNNRKKMPKGNEIGLHGGIDRLLMNDMLLNLRKGGYIGEEFVSGTDPTYRILAKGRSILGKYADKAF